MISPLIEFKNIYDKSGIPVPFEDYIKRAGKIIGIIFGSSMTILLPVHFYFFRITGYRLLISIGALTVSLTLLSVIFFMLYPMYKNNENTKQTDEGLLYSLGYMTVLASSGLGIEHIMEKVAEVEDNNSIKQLATKFILNIKLFGMDISTSLEDVSNRSASNVLNNIIESINNSLQTSGDIKSLFKFEVDRQMQQKRIILNKTLNSLTYLGEIYVALLIIAPVLFILMLTILSILGSSSIESSTLQLNLLTFVGVPIMAIGFLIVLDTTIGGNT